MPQPTPRALRLRRRRQSTPDRHRARHPRERHL